jgi:F-type H+-transporting ATPase subunit gamma
MAKGRELKGRIKSVENTRKITRTMEMVATSKMKRAQDRVMAARPYATALADVISSLYSPDLAERFPLLRQPAERRHVALVVLTSNRGLAGGYNGNVLRVANRALNDAAAEGASTSFEVAGKRGIAFFRFRGATPEAAYTQFEDRPQFDQVEELANRYIALYVNREIDRLDVAYTRFLSVARQEAVVETLLPMSAGQVGQAVPEKVKGGAQPDDRPRGKVEYEFLPDPRSILEEIVPVSFKVRLFKCFLDAAVSEQIARMVAMRGATENADDMIKSLTRQYNRARQAQITRELAEIIGGAAALE